MRFHDIRPLAAEGLAKLRGPGRSRAIAGLCCLLVGFIAEHALAQGVSSGTSDQTLAILGALILTAGLVISIAAHALQARGDVAVTLDYPSSLRGTFSIRLSRQKIKGTRGSSVDPANLNRASSRYEHNMVSRETQFHGVPSRRYFVFLEGQVENQTSGERKTFVEEKAIAVDRGRIARVEFDLNPSECAVSLKVVRGDALVDDARVAIAGSPESLRYARNGALDLELSTGTYTLIVGGGGAILERSLEIENLEAMNITVDLNDSFDLVFENCPEAVDPYLHGDYEGAGTALERAGDLKRGRVLSARSLMAKGDYETAATQFVAAERLFDGAQCYAEVGSWEKAAALFQQAGDPAQAAELYNAAGDLVRAGRAYEEANDLESATICYRDAEAVPKLIEVLEKRAEYFEAGKLSFERNDKLRAARNLQHVTSQHPEYEEACRLLANIYLEEGRIEMALQRAEETVSLDDNAKGSSDTFAWFADILEKAGDTDRALRALEKVEEREPDRNGLKDRITSLRKRQSISRAFGTSFSKGQGVGAGKRYELISEVGRGGMGIVYKAQDTRLARVVALKRLPDNLKENPKAVQLFLREARSAAALNHPNIVTLHDVDQEDNVFFLTMEFLEGLTLSQILRKRGKLSTPDVVRLGVQAAAGLQYAHDRRIIHRDIKTANLLFTRDKVLKIMDFGLAKMLEEVRRAKTLVGGTPYYMSPEQVTGKGVDHRADLYSLGVTLYELAAGRVPFKEGDIMWHHRNTPPPDPRSINPEVDSRLAALLLQILEKDAARRPQTASEISQALLGILDAGQSAS